MKKLKDESQQKLQTQQNRYEEDLKDLKKLETLNTINENTIREYKEKNIVLSEDNERMFKQLK